MEGLEKTDPTVQALIQKEIKRQREGLELIPSENYASRAVLEALSSPLCFKYAEGYPGKRYYGGNIYIDKVEELAQKRAQELFRTDYLVNVQPYSGSPANMAVLLGLLNFNDTIMGLALDQGGHLTHGHKVNFSGRAYNVVQYGVDRQTERLDYDQIEKLASEVKPKLIICGYTAYPRVIDFERFLEIARKVGAYLMADISHIAGLIAAGLHPSPFGLADVITTTTHKTLRGPRGAVIFSKTTEIADKVNRAVFPGIQGGPHESAIAAKAVCFKEAMEPGFKKYSEQIIKNAEVLSESLKKHGFRIVSGGTDNHLLLIDLTSIGITGKEAEGKLDKVGITVNKNTIPFDKRSPLDPSGIRIGTPAITSRGMKEAEMIKIAELLFETLNADQDELQAIGSRVKELASKFVLPGAEQWPKN